MIKRMVAGIAGVLGAVAIALLQPSMSNLGYFSLIAVVIAIIVDRGIAQMPVGGRPPGPPKRGSEEMPVGGRPPGPRPSLDLLVLAVLVGLAAVVVNLVFFAGR